MRVCRFSLDELILTGFYRDDCVIPIDQAVDPYSEETGDELSLPTTDNLLDLLPPDGPAFRAARILADWIDGADPETLADLAIPIDEIRLLVPIGAPQKVFLLAGNYAAHVVERGGTIGERTETFPYVFMKPPTTTLTHPGDPIRIPRVSPNHAIGSVSLAS
jgi:2-keto-4-pentenoate hydratase/2-oxohepta-3-ene-1,7-dioic acid hydratase in catechol pathway